MAKITQPIFIASDHAGAGLKTALQKLLSNWRWEDLGPEDSGPSVDYPDFARDLARNVARSLQSKTERLGVLICGSGIGMSIAANKIPGIRAAVVENPVAARLAREHNHANVLCLGARFLAPGYAAEITRAWLDAEPSQDARHIQRVNKINDLEKL